jgi:hypothetical protein
MTELPKPAFSTEEEILEGGRALANAEDTTTSRVEDAVELGEPLMDGDFAHVRLMRRSDALLYQVFRGPGVPAKFWGEGEFGLVILAMAEAYWPMDKPNVEYHDDTCRPEVYEDDPKGSPKFPEHYYGAYLIVVEGIDRKLNLTEERIRGMVEGLDDELKRNIGEWSNGS